MPEREKRFAYCRRMMSEVIDHFDSVDLTPYFLTACDSGKASKSVVYDINRQSVHQAYCDRHCRIPHVELANQRSLKPMAEQNEPGAVSMIYGFCNSVGGICIEPNRGNLAQRLCNNFGAVLVVRIDKDICVVKLDVVDHNGFRKIVQELRPLIEKRRVVFISFENEVLGIAERGALRQVFGDPTNQEARRGTSLPEQPCHQGGRRCLSMCSCHDDIRFFPEEKFLQCFRKGAITQLSVQD